ncbi:MAG: hypothetical protein PHW55_11160 [Methanothrix sp.]|nr:hypothetical protein [Methanothrix sp.]
MAQARPSRDAGPEALCSLSKTGLYLPPPPSFATEMPAGAILKRPSRCQSLSKSISISSLKASHSE